MHISFTYKKALAPACLFLFFCNACTMTVHAVVKDQSGRPVQDAVVFATPFEKGLQRAVRAEAVVVLKKSEFHPSVLPVQIGTAVTFQNRDSVRHHLYSISAANKFDRLAERGASSAPVVFDRPGVVVTGCSMHDRMLGHIYVVGAPHFAKTGKDGKADLAGIPRRGAYEVRVWHADMKGISEAATQRVAASGREVSVDFKLPLKGYSAHEKSAPLRLPPAGKGAASQ